jgi:L-lactate dehydrogenase (cytochrome)
MVQRQLPKPADVFEYLQFKTPQLDRKKARLDAALTIEDLRTIAKRRTPKAAFDYTDGSAEAEISIQRARQAFRDVEFHPEVLRDVADVDTTATVFGATSRMPFGIAPTGFTRLMQTEGETAGAGAANAAGIPVAGARLRDKRNGFSIPPQLTVKTIVDALPRPWWWIDFLTTPKLEFASLSATGGTVGDLLDMAMDPTISFEDLKVIRDLWPGKLAIKGVQSVEDAKRFADLGVDGIVLSNHGGRQLDRAPVPFHLLPEVVREVGNDTDVLVDTGIMNGADIVAAVALGAKFTLIGRAYLYGLMAGGRAGVDRTNAILTDQIIRTMKLLGAHSLDELEPRHVTQLERLVPRARG